MSGQADEITLAQNAATADGNGTNILTEGYEKVFVEIQKSGTGTSNANLEGSYDGGTTWYALGYEEIDAQATLTRAVAAIALGAGAVNHTYAVLDPAPLTRVRLSGTVGTISVTARVYDIPA